MDRVNNREKSKPENQVLKSKPKIKYLTRNTIKNLMQPQLRDVIHKSRNALRVHIS